MKYISTTELRTKSTELVNDLKTGIAVTLIHRSEVVGVIVPSEKSESSPQPNSLEKFVELARSSTKTSQSMRDKTYAKHMKERYG